MDKNQEFIKQFEKNRNLIFQFRKDYEEYLTKSNNWKKPAFSDATITHQQYFDELVRISNVEYSEEQYNAVKTVEIEERMLIQYINNLKQQYDNLALIYKDLKSKTS